MKGRRIENLEIHISTFMGRDYGVFSMQKRMVYLLSFLPNIRWCTFTLHVDAVQRTTSLFICRPARSF